MFRTSIPPRLGVEFNIFIDAVANQQVTVIGIDGVIRFGGIPVLKRDYIFDNPLDMPAGDSYQFTEKVPVFPAPPGRYEGRFFVLGPGGKDIGCLDFWFILAKA